MKELSKIRQALPESGIRKLQVLSAQIPDAVHLETGEPNYITPAYIREAAKIAMDEGCTKYTPVPGYPSLRKTVSEDFSRNIGVKISEKEVVVTGGAVMGLTCAVMAMADAGEEILIPDPSWPVYEIICLALGIKAVPYVMKIENDFQPKAEDLEKLITPETKAILVNNPSNPTGAVFDEDTVKMLMALAKKHDLYIIEDQIYDYLVFEGKHHSLKALDDDGRVVSISGVSKKYAMTGWRLGYVIASEQIAGIMNQVMVMLTGNASSVSQKAAEAAIRGPQDFVAESFDDYRGRRDAVAEILREEGIRFFYPHGAFYMCIDITPARMDSDTFAVKLLNETHVSVAPGITFGKSFDGFIRISLGTEMENLVKGAQRIAGFIKKYSSR